MAYYTKFMADGLEQDIERVRSKIYEKTGGLNILYRLSKEPVPFAERLEGDFKPVHKGDVWGELWDCGWFRFTGHVPETAKGKKVVLLIDISGEACVFDQNGTPVRGLTNVSSEFDPTLGNPGKRVFILSDCSAGGEPVDLWVEGGNNDLFGKYRNGRIVDADIAVCRENVRQLYYDLVVLKDLLNVLDKDGAQYYTVLYALRNALDGLEFYSEDEIEAARAVLRPELEKKSASPSLRFSAIGHAHIDLAWLWPLRETKRKAGRTFSTVIDLMNRYPEYRFGASQPQMFDWVRQMYPGLYEKIRQKVQEKRFECQGAMWVEPDTNLPSGESLVRQLYYGKTYFRQEFGEDMKIAWLPDVFGFTAALPQLLKQAGVDYLLTIKLSWNKQNKFPYSTFNWKGLTEDSVLVHMPPDGTYNSAALPRTLKNAEKRFQEKGLSDQAMVLFGIGDGGGGPGPEHLESLRRIGDLAGLSPVRQRFASEFFSDIARCADKFRAYRGEMYLDVHQGTYTTQSRNKKENRRMENLLRETEFTCAIALLKTGHTYPSAQLEKIWKEVLLYQFHDILPGSAIKRVYDETAARYEALAAETGALLEEARRAVCNGKVPSVFNSLGWERRDFINVDGEYYEVCVPALGFAPIEAEKAKPEVSTSGEALENELVRAVFLPDGTLDGLFDKKTGQRLLGRSNQLNVYCDDGDAWDLDRNYLSKPVQNFKLQQSRSYVDGPFAVREQVLVYGKSRVEQKIRLKSGDTLLEFVNRADWHESAKMLRADFETGIRSEKVSCDIQFGFLERPTTENNSFDSAEKEICAHKYVDLSENGRGVALINDCKYGHRVKNGKISLNLLRSTKFPGANADRGAHEFRYAIYAHAGNFANSDVIRKAYEFNSPLHIFEGDGKQFSLASVNAENIVIETVKKCETDDALILRLYESKGKTTDAALNFHVPVKSAKMVNLMEEEQCELGVSADRVALRFKPFEIISIKVQTGAGKA